MKTLTPHDYIDAAKALKCSDAAIRAVAMVESGGRPGFDDNGRLLIRFEGHIFRKHTGGKFDASHPHLSYPYSRRFNKPRKYDAFNEAFALDPNAAMMATSYGMFQPMGFNHDEMGYDTVGEMLDDFKTGERAQLDAFVRIIKKWGLDDELRRARLEDFAVFAKRYNGADYKSNRYDEKMHNNYKRFLKSPIKVAPPIEQSDVDDLVSQIQETENVQVSEQSATPAPVADTKPVEVKAPVKENSTSTAVKTTVLGFAVPAFLGGIVKAISDAISQGYVSTAQIGEFVIGLIRENQKYVFMIVAALIVLLAVKKICKQITLWIQMWFASDPSKNNVEVIPQ